MQIGSNVPNMIGTAALQFTAYLAQTSLEASIRRRKNKGNSHKSIFRFNSGRFQPLVMKNISDYEKKRARSSFQLIIPMLRKQFKAIQDWKPFMQMFLVR